ncbi:MAG TPA: hypothetical protein DCK98_01430 [Chloroflexi bacterium]|nr:hypothetical protein [Chloroflexota bacterium]HAL25813.1 hypothetical protein [Chloroflexota bacterium]
MLVGFGEGWTEPGDFRFRPTFCLEERFQLEFTFPGGPDAVAAVVYDLARRFELAFGFTTPRVYDRSGSAIGSINYSRVSYE